MADFSLYNRPPRRGLQFRNGNEQTVSAWRLKCMLEKSAYGERNDTNFRKLVPSHIFESQWEWNNSGRLPLPGAGSCISLNHKVVELGLAQLKWSGRGHREEERSLLTLYTNITCLAGKILLKHLHKIPPNSKLQPTYCTLGFNLGIFSSKLRTSCCSTWKEVVISPIARHLP